MNQTKARPFLELLRSVPEGARYCEETPTSAHYFPVGRYCKEAAIRKGE
jgi:hypothetical protein